MATLTIKNVSARLVTRLKRQADRHHRSLNREVISCLERATAAVPIDVDAELARIRAIRVVPKGGPLTDAEISRYKRAGRA